MMQNISSSVSFHSSVNYLKIYKSIIIRALSSKDNPMQQVAAMPDVARRMRISANESSDTFVRPIAIPITVDCVFFGLQCNATTLAFSGYRTNS